MPPVPSKPKPRPSPNMPPVPSKPKPRPSTAPPASPHKLPNPNPTSPKPSQLLKTTNFKPAFLSVAFAATIATGAWYGLSLRTKSDFEKEVKRLEEICIEEKIKVLEESKKGLIAKRDGLERKIRQLEERRV